MGGVYYVLHDIKYSILLEDHLRKWFTNEKEINI